MWKLLWKELLLYTLSFLFISAVYRYVLTTELQLLLEKMIRWCRHQSTGVPISFLLGFYVYIMVKRWWEQYCMLPWPDTIAMLLKGLVIGETEEEKEEAMMVRKTVVRYCILGYILCIRRISTRLLKRFPSTDDLLKLGVLYNDEAVRISDEKSFQVHESNWWMPLKWAIEILTAAKEDGLIRNIPGFYHLIGRYPKFFTNQRWYIFK